MNDKPRYIPGHCCTTVNSHDRLYVMDDEDVVDVWPVISRGKSQGGSSTFHTAVIQAFQTGHMLDHGSSEVFRGRIFVARQRKIW